MLRVGCLSSAALPELPGVDPWLNTPDGEPLRLAAVRFRRADSRASGRGGDGSRPPPVRDDPSTSSHAWRRHTARFHSNLLTDATSRCWRRITLLHRRPGLRETMSDYLIRDLERYGVAFFAIGAGSLSCTARMASSRPSHSGAASAWPSRSCLPLGLARNGLQPRDRRRTPSRHGSRRGRPRGARTRRRTYDPTTRASIAERDDIEVGLNQRVATRCQLRDSVTHGQVSGSSSSPAP
jgi:hypothetical protein